MSAHTFTSQGPGDCIAPTGDLAEGPDTAGREVAKCANDCGLIPESSASSKDRTFYKEDEGWFSSSRLGSITGRRPGCRLGRHVEAGKGEAD